jgi:hypothetical protein
VNLALSRPVKKTLFDVEGRTIMLQFSFPFLPFELPQSVEVRDTCLEDFTVRKTNSIPGKQLINKDKQEYWEIEIADDFEFELQSEARQMPRVNGGTFEYQMVRAVSSKCSLDPEQKNYIRALISKYNFNVRGYLNSLETEFYSFNFDTHRRKNKSTATKKLIISRETIEIIDL